jgi:hypothetical protein
VQKEALYEEFIGGNNGQWRYVFGLRGLFFYI